MTKTVPKIIQSREHVEVAFCVANNIPGHKLSIPLFVKERLANSHKDNLVIKTVTYVSNFVTTMKISISWSSFYFGYKVLKLGKWKLTASGTELGVQCISALRLKGGFCTML